MANDLFQTLNLRDNVNRNSFSLSHNVKFTAKVGELLPIVHFTSLPTDVGQISHNHFTRTAPVQTAAYTRIREYFDWFFVPYRLLYKEAPSILTKNTRNPQTAQSAISAKVVGDLLPQISHAYLFRENADYNGVIQRLGMETNQFGLNRGMLSGKLLSYLGYGSCSQSHLNSLVNSLGDSPYPFRVLGNVSLFPLLAYQAIYYFWFRNTQWEENQPQNYNVDWMNSMSDTGVLWYVNPSENPEFWSNPTLFDLQYANYPKDLFFGILPNRQMGDEAEIAVDNELTPSVGVYAHTLNGNTSSVHVGSSQLSGNSIQSSNPVDDPLMPLSPLQVDASFKGAFTILELRRQQAIQKYAEILGTGDNNYKSILEKLFNADVSDKLNDMPIYLGGTSSEIKISEVENTNLTDGDATLKGKGVGDGKGSIKFNNKDEYGCVMCIYHAQPVVDYALNALHFDVSKISADDFAIPIFDSLGFVELPMYHVDISSGLMVSNHPFLGYTIRNYDYKNMVDRSLGGFRESELKTWYSPVDFDYLQDYQDNQQFVGINSSFFKVNPHIVDDIFVVGTSEDDGGYSGVDTDQLRVNANFQISVVRPLSKYGVPYAG